MRTLIFCTMLACLLLTDQLVVAQTANSQDAQKIYPDTPGKDFVIDAPWRVKTQLTAIPFILEIKDADENDLQELISLAMYRKNPEGNWIFFCFEDFGSIPITEGYFSHFEYYTPGQLGASSGDTIEVKAVLSYRDEITGSEIQQFTKYLRIIVGSELPNLSGKWYYGDAHYHTSFTDNPYEYGGSFMMIKSSAVAMGLDWAITTDHASNRSCYPWPCPGGVLVDDLDSDDWDGLVDSITSFSDNRFQLIIGEEITCNDGVVVTDNNSIHLLTYGLSGFVAGPVGLDLEGNPNTLRTLNAVMDEINTKNGITFASHPADLSDPWYNPYLGVRPWSRDNYVTALSYPHFIGLEAWNTRINGEKNIAYADQNPFPWEQGNKVAEARTNLLAGIRSWDSLLISKLPNTPPRKIFLVAGSDGHGDFNYNVYGKPDVRATDDAFGKVRTAVYCDAGMGSNGENIVNALRNGQSVVTDGPLVEFGIDMNNNGQIGVEDLRIGGQGNFNLNDPHNLIVRYESTEDFGVVDGIKIRLGHPSLGNGIETVIIEDGLSLGNYSGLISINLGDELLSLGISGWCFVRVEAYSGNNEYRCYTNPIWLNVYTGTGPSYFVSAWAGPNGSIDPSGTINIPQGGTVNFTAIPTDGYEVDTWFLDGNPEQTGNDSYTILDVQASHSLYVIFRATNASNVTVVAPNGGETWFSGRSAYITWQWNGDIGDYVKISLYRDAVLNGTIDNMATNNGKYQWSIPYGQTEACDYRVKVSSLDGLKSDLSDGYFCIQAPPASIDTVRIYTCADLQSVSTGGLKPPYGYYLLMNDIDARDCGNFDPIGSGAGYYFRGTFDGQNHIITRLKIDRPTEPDIGLFSILDDKGIIKNLNIEICSGSAEVGHGWAFC